MIQSLPISALIENITVSKSAITRFPQSTGGKMVNSVTFLGGNFDLRNSGLSGADSLFMQSVTHM